MRDTACSFNPHLWLRQRVDWPAATAILHIQVGPRLDEQRDQIHLYRVVGAHSEMQRRGLLVVHSVDVPTCMK